MRNDIDNFRDSRSSWGGGGIMRDSPCRSERRQYLSELKENHVSMSFRCARENVTYGANFGVLVVEL